MKEKLIEYFKLEFVQRTKWNEIYQNDMHVFIFNRATSEVKIKPR